MHDAAAPPINKNSPAVMAARLAGYLSCVQAIGERLIEPPPTKRDIREAEREAHPDHVKHLKLRFAEGIPRIVSLQSVELLTHIRRVEYQLRCFILWLAAILVEKAQKNPDFHRSLFSASRATAKAQAVEPMARNKAEQTQRNTTDPCLRRDERGSCGHLQVTTQAQRDRNEVEGFARADTNNPNQISDLVWKQELQMRRLSADTYPIGRFSITTPVIEGKRRSHRFRMRHLTPDRSRMVDASYLVARLARLPRILARADQMAERLARKALSTAPPSPLLGEGPGVRGFRATQIDPVNRFGEKVWLQRAQTARPPHPKPFSPPGGEGLLPTISVSLARTPPPNPLYFEPLTRVVPPDKLWNSTEDDEERGDMTWLHFIAGDTLQRTGYAPGPDKGSCLPDFSRFEPPAPPQVRAT